MVSWAGVVATTSIPTFLSAVDVFLHRLANDGRNGRKGGPRKLGQGLSLLIRKPNDGSLHGTMVY